MEVTIIGCGFAALAAIKRLRSLDPGRRVKITVIAPHPRFVFLPSLIWIPSGARTGDRIQVSLDEWFEQMGVDFRPGTVAEIRDGGRTVVTERENIPNDALLIASGADYLRKAPGAGNALNPCAGVAAAETIRDRVARLPGGVIAMGFGGNPNEPTAIRGGPMFEFLFGLHTQLKRQGRRDRFKLVFYAPMPEPGKRLGPKAVKGLLAAMAKRGIETHLGHKITGFTPDRVRTAGGDIPADLILFLPGMTGPAWLKNTGLELSEGGFLKADRNCRVAGAERVYAAGDVGSFPGPDWRAKQGHMAELQACAAAENLYRELKGQTARTAFRTELICIVDTLDSGIMVSRFKWFNLILPPMRLMHWVKRLLEFKSLYPYRISGSSSRRSS